MTTGHVFIATSLDGYIARADDSLDWLMRHGDAGQDTGYDAFMNSVDGLVMGRSTFQTVLGFGEWPYAKPVLVLSRTLTSKDIPEDLRDRVQIRSETPVALMNALQDEGWRRAYIDGGSVIRSFLRNGLIADIVITVVPVLIGAGKPLFGTLSADIDLTLIDGRTFPPGFVQSTYRVT